MATLLRRSYTKAALDLTAIGHVEIVADRVRSLGYGVVVPDSYLVRQVPSNKGERDNRLRCLFVT